MDLKTMKEIENNFIVQNETHESKVSFEPQNEDEKVETSDKVAYSSSSSSIYMTAEEDFPSNSEDDGSSSERTMGPETEESSEGGISPNSNIPRIWVTGSAAVSKNKKWHGNNKEALRKTKSAGPMIAMSLGLSSSTINNQRDIPANNLASSTPRGSRSNLLESIPGAEINQLQSSSSTNCCHSNTKEHDETLCCTKEERNEAITVTELQKIFDKLKQDWVNKSECDKIIDRLNMIQSRNDFQWALHQLGGSNALLFLYARVVQICKDDCVQSKALSLALGQLKNHSKATDVPPSSQYNLIRFILASEKSVFGFKTFVILVNSCLNQSGNKLLDYELLDACLLSSWRALTRVRCTDNDAPTGHRSLFEALLTIILDLLLEKNAHRTVNVTLLKAKNFSDRILAICCSMVFECAHLPGIPTSPAPSPASLPHSLKKPSLSSIDALRISALIKSIFSELMTPTDAYVAISLAKHGLYPLLPKDAPFIPGRDDAFFLFPTKAASRAVEAYEEEIICEDGPGRGGTSIHFASSIHLTPPKTQATISPHEPPTLRVQPPQETLDDVVLMNEDIPEIVGKSENNGKDYNKDTFEQSQYDAFRETFQESLVEALMAVMLNALAILPDGAFHSVLRPHLTSHLFVAYSAHPNSHIKHLAIKLLSSYLSRVKNPCLNEFLKNRGFYLVSMYIREDITAAYHIIPFCQAFGPVSFPLALSLLNTNQVMSTIQEWIEVDEAASIPALMSTGFIPTVLRMQKRTGSLPRTLTTILSSVVRYTVLNPKDDPWRSLFCPSIESAPVGCQFIGTFYQEAITVLKSYNGKELKKTDAMNRLLWLLERGAASRCCRAFEVWLLNLFTSEIMELDADDNTQTDIWKSFVKKYRKRLTFLMGVLLARNFIPHKVDFETKHQTLRTIIQNSPNLEKWLPKVLKSDAVIERCFTAFLRIFLVEANKKEESNLEVPSSPRSPNFESLLAEGDRLSMQLTPGRPKSPLVRTTAIVIDEIQQAAALEGTVKTREEKAIREKIENILVDAGILSPTNNFSTFSADFRKFKILLETPPICGVSYQELRLCLAQLDKIRQNLTPTLSPSPPAKNETNLKLRPSFNRGYHCNIKHFEAIFETAHKFAVEVAENVTRNRTQTGVEIVKSVATREEDIIARRQWWSIVEQLCHPKAPWYFPELYPRFWALDETEGPHRVRLRLKREHLKIDQRFVKPKCRVADTQLRKPLDYLFKSEDDLEELMTFPSIKSEIQFMRFCNRIILGDEVRGELILSMDTLYFIPDWQANSSRRQEHFEVSLSSISNILRRRYSLQHRSVEIFVDSRSYLFVFADNKDREEFMNLTQIKPTQHGKNSIILDSNLTTMTNKWMKGHLSNFEYLMFLNTAGGRSYCDLMQYPVFPFVIAKYDSPTLDLFAPQSYRDLRRPMAIQDPSKEEQFKATYNYLKREADFAPFHYGSHYSNSGTVLHFMTRLPPYTQNFICYQDGNFDLPDRSFHSVDTTWKLASRESNTDFKESIPEFYYLPEFLLNLQQFDFGVRQNQNRVDDVELPAWAKGNARLFTLINRQALESNHVRKYLSDWIDLIFGYKQTGRAAVLAMNCFHPATYEGFPVEKPGDDLMTNARKTMVATYGQTPKQLFAAPHPRSMAVSVENCQNVQDVIETVWGIRWGTFLGSPICRELEVVNTREYAEEMALNETPTRIVFWPKYTLIMGDNVVGRWSPTEIQIKSRVIHLCVGDEITTCATTENSIWVGHHSGKITVLRLSQNLGTIIETFELVGHYKPIKSIDLNAEFSTAVSCSGENCALIWDMISVKYINEIEWNSPIDSVYSSRSTGDIVLLSREDNAVMLTTINGFIVDTIYPGDAYKIESACISSMDPGRNVNLLAVGCRKGYIRFFSTWDLRQVNDIKVAHLSHIPVQSIRYSKDGRRLYCLSTNDEVSISAALQLPDSPR